MKVKTVYILWNYQQGYQTAKVYKNIESAEIALKENYTDFWILNEYAKIETIELVDYIK